MSSACWPTGLAEMTSSSSESQRIAWSRAGPLVPEGRVAPHIEPPNVTVRAEYRKDAQSYRDTPHGSRGEEWAAGDP